MTSVSILVQDEMEKERVYAVFIGSLFRAENEENQVS